MTVVVTGALIVTFVLGFASGWFAGRSKRLPAVANRNATSGPSVKEAPVPRDAPAAPVGGGSEPSFTFYETLPKGGKAVIGTGINAPRPVERSETITQPGASDSGDKKPGIVKSAHDTAVSKPDPASVKAPETRTPPGTNPLIPSTTVVGGKGKYAVQIASYREKREAEAERDRLTAKGLPVYLQELHLQDKTVWYRVRVGKSLDHKEASELAGKVGKGALVVQD